MKNMKNLTAPLACAAFAFSCATATADDVSLAQREGRHRPGEGQSVPRTTGEVRPEIADVTISGSGCPGGSYQIIRHRDSETGPADLELLFHEYRVRGSATGSASQLATCQIVLNVKAPKGYRHAVEKVEYYGHTILTEGVSAELYTRYGWIGGPIIPSQEKRHTFVGPKGLQPDDRDLVVIDQVPDDVVSRCDETRPFRIDTRLQMYNPRLQVGEIALGSVSRIQLKLLRC